MTMDRPQPAGSNSETGFWLDTPEHQAWLMEQAHRQLEFFSASCRNGPGFFLLNHDGSPQPGKLQELHNTTRLVHSYALGHLVGFQGAEKIIDHGMAYLESHHQDPEFGGYFWSLDGDRVKDDRKLAYGHVFVLLAAASAKQAGHPNADKLMANVRKALDTQFWDDDAGLFCDEWNRDWTPFSSYRGMNANMHGVEALLAAFEGTGDETYLTRAGRILDFFINKIAPEENWRLPEHYTRDWQIDRSYAGDPMFRPAGTTPGHSFELGRLQLQHWDLSGRPESGAPYSARQLIEQALHDAWLPDGGLAYTLDFDGQVANASRFWWPVTEAISAVAALITIDRKSEDERWYRMLWGYANDHFIDHRYGGWFPAVDETGKIATSIFGGKPDIYHSLQACLFPQSGRLSRMFPL
ncbi:AGE family epimerase/isomerase [uncultured Ruegeria sp.]|uniref:AGE family epimerase/isomerase n=1 Tax=uncultured Ruegeria sp. TaxID=259304 RepID=UPI002625077A|nr:AGE family epimerase/isomerase [uncultured Ruegeria sp.]